MDKENVPVVLALTTVALYTVNQHCDGETTYGCGCVA